MHNFNSINSRFTQRSLQLISRLLPRMSSLPGRHYSFGLSGGARSEEGIGQCIAFALISHSRSIHPALHIHHSGDLGCATYHGKGTRGLVSSIKLPGSFLDFTLYTYCPKLYNVMPIDLVLGNCTSEPRHYKTQGAKETLRAIEESLVWQSEEAKSTSKTRRSDGGTR